MASQRGHGGSSSLPRAACLRRCRRRRCTSRPGAGSGTHGERGSRGTEQSGVPDHEVVHHPGVGILSARPRRRGRLRPHAATRRFIVATVSASSTPGTTANPRSRIRRGSVDRPLSHRVASKRRYLKSGAETGSSRLRWLSTVKASSGEAPCISTAWPRNHSWVVSHDRKARRPGVSLELVPVETAEIGLDVFRGPERLRGMEKRVAMSFVLRGAPHCTSRATISSRSSTLPDILVLGARDREPERAVGLEIDVERTALPP